MPNERFTDLPTVTNSNLSDIICAVQGFIDEGNPGISVQQSLQQVSKLFKDDVVANYAGNPNGFVAGVTYQFCWDTVNLILYVCTQTGSSTTAVWTKSIQLTAGSGITIVQNGNNIQINATGGRVGFNLVTGVTANMVSNSGYTANNASQPVNLVLPATSVYGDIIQVCGLGAGGWYISQGSSQRVVMGNLETTSGATNYPTSGFVASTNQFDCVQLYCVTANDLWQVYGAQGNPQVF